MAPSARIGGLALGLDLQGYSSQFIAAIAQPITVGPLHHQKTALSQIQPAARLGDIGQALHLQLIQQLIAADLAQFHPHKSIPITRLLGPCRPG